MVIKWGRGGKCGLSEVAQSELLIYGNTSAVIVKIKWLPEQRSVWCVSGQAQEGTGHQAWQLQSPTRKGVGDGGRIECKGGRSSRRRGEKSISWSWSSSSTARTRVQSWLNLKHTHTPHTHTSHSFALLCSASPSLSSPLSSRSTVLCKRLLQLNLKCKVHAAKEVGSRSPNKEQPLEMHTQRDREK